MVARPVGHSFDFRNDRGDTVNLSVLDRPGSELRPDHRAVNELIAGSQPPLRDKLRHSCRGAGAARRAIHLPIREDGDVALMECAIWRSEVVIEDRPVEPGEPWIARMLGQLAPFDVPLD